MWAMQNAVTRIPVVEEPDAVEDAPLPMIPARPDMAIASRHV